MWGMLYKHITDSTNVQPYTLLAPAHTALVDILYKNGENGVSAGPAASSLVLTRCCLGWSCSLFSPLWLLIADSASQWDCHEVLRSFSLLIWPDNLNRKSKGFSNLHQVQEWEISRSPKYDLVTWAKTLAVCKTYTFQHKKSISYIYLKKNTPIMVNKFRKMCTLTVKHTCVLLCTLKWTHRLWKSN